MGSQRGRDSEELREEAGGIGVKSMQRHILSVNSGSSSIKFTRFRMGGGQETPIIEGAVEAIGLPQARLWLRDDKGRESRYERDLPDHHRAFAAAFAAMEERHPEPMDAVGHRVVHGGPAHQRPERVTPELLDRLEQLTPLAPLHNPPALDGIRAIAALRPAVPQVVCFDTAFHRRMPLIAQRLPLPGDLWRDGVRRYGFHGLSYEYVLQSLGNDARGRVIIAHLGNGASLVAVRDGHPLDTTMGFTPTGGVMMGTRSGDLDPGVLLYLLKSRAYDAERLERLVEHESGLLGVSGTTSDMAALLARSDSDEHAALAVELFAYLVRKQVGALAAVLGGLDRLVFTGGIGEHAAPVRWAICRGFEHLGIRLDPHRNEQNAADLTADGARCRVLVIPTNEALMIARHTRAEVFHEAR
jgi:acetate kinase